MVRGLAQLSRGLLFARLVQLAGELRGLGFLTGRRGITTGHSLWRIAPP
jgi:hypothetical protein